MLSPVFEHLFDLSRLPVAIAALSFVSVLGLITGPLAHSTTPLYWRVIDIILGDLGMRLDKTKRKVADLILRGFVVTILGIGFTIILSQIAQRLAHSYDAFHLVEIFFLSLLLAAGSVWKALLKLHKALAAENVVEGAYYTIARSTRTNLSVADNYTITRTGMGLALRSFDKAVVSPLFWYIAAGLSGAFVYAALSALVWRFGKDGFSKGFGRIPLLLEKLFGIVPHILSGFLIALAAVFTPTARMSRALQGWGAAKGELPYEEGGIPVTSGAWGLDVSLGGASQDLEGSAIKRSWAGPKTATAQLTAGHLYRAVYLSVMAHILLLAVLFGLFVLSGQPSLSLDFLP